jgi:hypothetical protein
MMNALMENIIVAKILNASTHLGVLNVAVKAASSEMEVYALVS